MPKPRDETPRRFKRPTVQPDGDSRTRLRVSRRRGFAPRVPSLHGEPEFPRVRRPVESYGRDRQKMASGTSHRTPSVAGDVPVGYGGGRVCGGAEGSGRVREEGLRMPGDRGPWLGGSALGLCAVGWGGHPVCLFPMAAGMQDFQCCDWDLPAAPTPRSLPTGPSLPQAARAPSPRMGRARSEARVTAALARTPTRLSTLCLSPPWGRGQPRGWGGGTLPLCVRPALGPVPRAISPQSSSETLLFRACASRLSLGGSHHPRMWLAVHGRRLASPRRPLCSHRNKMPPPEWL